MKRELDEIGPSVVHKLFAAELGRPGANAIPKITIGNKFHSIKHVLDRDEELKKCIILGFSRDGNHLISYTPSYCGSENVGFSLQLWTFTPEQPCRKLWSLPIFRPTEEEEEDNVENRYGEEVRWLTRRVSVYETTDSSLFIVHGREDLDNGDGVEKEVEHHLAVCPGPKALTMLDSSSSSTNNSNGSGGGSGAPVDQSLHISTVHFQAITVDNSHAEPVYNRKTNQLEPEVSIMEIPELVSIDAGGGDESGYSPTTVAIGVNEGSSIFFTHVRLGLPDSPLAGWTTYSEEHDPKGSPEQRRRPLAEKKATYGDRDFDTDNLNVWKTRQEMQDFHGLYFQESMVTGNGRTVSVDASSSPQPNNKAALQIAVRMPNNALGFDDIIGCNFLPKYKLSVSSISDYYVQKVVDTSQFVYTTDNILENDFEKAYRSHYCEVPCTSPSLPNEPGLIFAVVVKFHEDRLKKQFLESSDVDATTDTLFETGVVAIFVHNFAVSGVSHIIAELPWPEFKDPTKIVSRTRPELEYAKNYPKPSFFQVFQEKLAVPASFENSLMVLSNSEMIREQGSLKALYHPVLPQWLVGSTVSIEAMQELATYTWGDEFSKCGGMRKARGMLLGKRKILERRW